MMKEQNLQMSTSDNVQALLQNAIRSHADGDIDKAIALYNQLLKLPDVPNHVFQNLISCLRSKKSLLEGLEVAKLWSFKIPN